MEKGRPSDFAARVGETEEKEQVKRGEAIILDVRWFLELSQ